MSPLFLFLLFLGVFLGAAAVVYLLVRFRYGFALSESRAQADQIYRQTVLEVEEIKAKSLLQLEKSREVFSDLEKRYQLQVQRSEKNIKMLEEKLVSKGVDNQKVEKEITELNEAVLKVDNEFLQLKLEVLPTLSRTAGVVFEKALADLKLNLAQELELAHETRIAKVVDNATEQSAVLAKNYLIQAIQRFSAPTSVEKKSLIIPINRNETKARLIGKNGEIVAFLESELGVDIVFDDSKPGVTVSHFELVKKHIARETIMKLLKDRVIDLEKAKKRLEEARAEAKVHLIDIGDKIVKKLDLSHRKFPQDFKEILGRLRYRTSYGQNILKHCFEVGYFTLLLGNELGLSHEVCKIGGFFHDLGKAIDQEDGRPHDILTKEIMERFGIFSWEEIHAAWTHHDAIPIETPEALLVKAADAISAGRPGARQETIEKYLARVMAIESIANSYEGVQKTYAISGGRELRVLVDPKRLEDENLTELAGEIAKEIEANVAYPGQIKVNVIRRIQHNRTIKDKSKK